MKSDRRDLNKILTSYYGRRRLVKMHAPAGSTIRYSIAGTEVTGTVWCAAPRPRCVWVRRDGVDVWDVVKIDRFNTWQSSLSDDKARDLALAAWGVSA